MNVLVRVTADLRSFGHPDAVAEALAKAAVKSWRGRVPQTARRALDAELREAGPTADALLQHRPSRAELDRLGEQAGRRRAKSEGLLRTLRSMGGTGAVGVARVMGTAALAEAAVLTGEVFDLDEPDVISKARRALDEAVKRDRLIGDAIRLRRKPRARLAEALPGAADGGGPSIGGVQTPVTPATKDRSGKASNPAFEKEHPRAAKGRVGGGAWIQKGDGMQGDPNAMVKMLQARLSQLGYKADPDGRFGPVTVEALKAFQKATGLEETGQLDDSTVETLRNPPTNTDGSMRTTTQVDAEAAAAAGPTKKKAAASSAGTTATGGGSGVGSGSAAGDTGSAGKGGATTTTTTKTTAPDGTTTTKTVKTTTSGGSTAKAGSSASKPAASGGKASSASSGLIRRGDGMTGKADSKVEKLQTDLAALGFDLGEGGVDGRFGEGTEAAVRAFQKKNGLRVDGVAGPQTLAMMKQVAASGKKDVLNKVGLGEGALVSVLERRLQEAVEARTTAKSGSEFERARAREAVLRERLAEAEADGKCLKGHTMKADAKKCPECGSPMRKAKKVEESPLTSKARKKLPESAFAIPPNRYPIHDLAHARNALSRASGKPEESRVKAAVYRRYPELKPKGVQESDSRSLPDLPNKPGKSNWVEKKGGLPGYIKRIAKHLRSEKGMDTSRAIATAVNVAKKMCASGKTNLPNSGQVNAKSRAEACAAVAQWEKMKGSALAEQHVRTVALAEASHSAADLTLQWAEIVALVEALDGKDGEKLQEDAAFEQKHLRGRGGKFRDVLDQLSTIKPGYSRRVGGQLITRGMGDESHVFVRQVGPNDVGRGSMEDVAGQLVPGSSFAAAQADSAELNRQQGHADGYAGRPRAIGGTNAHYRRAYNRGQQARLDEMRPGNATIFAKSLTDEQLDAHIAQWQSLDQSPTKRVVLAAYRDEKRLRRIQSKALDRTRSIHNRNVERDEAVARDQTSEQSASMRKEIARLGVPTREETLPDGTRRLTWRIGTRSITKTIGRTGAVA